MGLIYKDHRNEKLCYIELLTFPATKLGVVVKIMTKLDQRFGVY